MADIRTVWLHAHNMLRSGRRIVNESLRPLNLSSAEGNILVHLLLTNRELGQEQLAEQLDVSTPAVSRALDSLEAKGLVTRQQAAEDRRVHKVRLTREAREIGPAIEQAYAQLYTLAMQGISQEELDYFVKLFSRMSENLVGAMAAIAKNVEHQNAAE